MCEGKGRVSVDKETERAHLTIQAVAISIFLHLLSFSDFLFRWASDGTMLASKQPLSVAVRCLSTLFLALTASRDGAIHSSEANTAW